MSLAEQVLLFIQSHQLISSSSRVLVGLSGGADSIALTHILNALKYELGITLEAAHFNHGLRDEADKEERLVQDFCLTLNIPLTCGKNTTPYGNDSLEQQARIRRLAFFQNLTAQKKIDTLALAHHQDDQAETVLMRLIRGCGLNGLAAIRPKRTINGMTIVRPLLATPKSDIENYIQRNKLKYCVDSSNSDIRFLRNKVRHSLKPLLEREFNLSSTKLARLAETCADDYDYLYNHASQHFETVLQSQHKDEIQLNCNLLKDCPSSVQRMVIRIAIEKFVGHLRKIELSHLQMIIELIENHSDQLSEVHLPNDVKVIVNRSYVLFKPLNPKS